MNEGGNFKDFMEQMFLDILTSFNRMVAEMAANRLFYETFGSILTEGGKKFKPAFGAAIPGVGTQMAPPSMGEGFAGKFAPGVVINVENTGTPMNARITSQKTVAGKTIVNMLLEEMDTNPNTASRIRGG